MFALVTALRGRVCKTVGSAYDGSNPSPATRCENAPLATNSRASGAFPLCPSMCHLVALVGHGSGDDRRAYAVRGRSEGNSMGKSACLLDYAGAAEGLGAATGYRPSRRCLASVTPGSRKGRRDP
jgi:hypothetical protein